MHEDDDTDFREWAKEMHPCNGEDPLAAARGYMISGTIGALIIIIVFTIWSWRAGWW